MSATGTVFDIKQLAVFDGPGIRTTVFFKGCPLRCQWCHNPEGLSREPQLMVGSGCIHCGKCQNVCPTPDHCTACGVCTSVCPLGLRRICGARYTARSLADLLLKDADYLRANGGGYTISGGEPTFQPEFLLELLRLLQGSHRAVETCGCCPSDTFARMLMQTELVLMDVKLAAPALHKHYTGRDNGLILENLRLLQAERKPHIIRIPVIPGVNDSEENFRATAHLLENDPALLGVELLPYHKTAGAKYAMVGAAYRPDFDPSQPPNLSTRPFSDAGIPCKIL